MLGKVCGVGATVWIRVAMFDDTDVVYKPAWEETNVEYILYGEPMELTGIEGLLTACGGGRVIQSGGRRKW